MREPVPTVLVTVSTDLQEVGAIQVLVLGVSAGTCLIAGAGLPSCLHLLLELLVDDLSGKPKNVSCRASSLARRNRRL